jgi:hypothetical protein
MAYATIPSRNATEDTTTKASACPPAAVEISAVVRNMSMRAT